METVNHRLYSICLGLFAFFALALFTSMAAMEILGWSLFLLALFAFFRGEVSLKELISNRMVQITFLFCVWIAVGLIWNRDRVPQIGPSLAELRWFFTLLGLTAAWALLLKRPLPSLLANAIIFCILIVSVYAIYQYFEGIDVFRKGRILPYAVKKDDGFIRYRPTGLFSLTLTFSAIYAMGTCLCLSISMWFWRQRRLWMSAICGLTTVLAFTAVLLSYSRGIWFALAAALLLMAYLYSRKFAAAIMIVLALASLGAFFGSQDIRERVESITDPHNRSNYARIYLWQINWAMFKANPVFGVGFENNGPPLVRTFGEAMGLTEDIDSHAHNNYLNMLSGTGLPGLILYLSMIGFGLYYSLREFRRRKTSGDLLAYFLLGSVGAQIVFHLGGLTEYSFGDAEVQYQLLAWLGLSIAVSRLKIDPRT